MVFANARGARAPEVPVDRQTYEESVWEAYELDSSREHGEFDCSECR